MSGLTSPPRDYSIISEQGKLNQNEKAAIEGFVKIISKMIEMKLINM